ncbi:hypothetical protein GO755_14960 [Spirosoma sp. HMF4905]|uniref:HTH luxR-type domain-containing protein n=1 Tax=Spirosoma arboris TaxID=2682092 RepID=A0A7K1SBZ0_9BACT|nr:LuxR C-terminal-related transcriptional regulator [Spirosoma arboris]MVM31342.1 hypothetical protein [Spirosoma arboris]
MSHELAYLKYIVLYPQFNPIPVGVFNQTPFSFSSYQKAWNSGIEFADVGEISDMLEHNPLLNQMLLMQGAALAVKDVSSMQYPLILGDVENVCGWPKELFFNEGVEAYIAKIPLADQPGLEEMTKSINAYVAALPPEKIKSFRAIFDYRMIRKDGRVARICQESIVLKTDQQGNILFFLALVSDISHVKRIDKQHLHLTDGTEHLLFEVDDTNQCSPLDLLSKREVEILKLLNQSLTSDQIAEKLFISVHTVNTHRQKMIRKMGMADTTDLLNFLKVYRLL